jgi:hypothetical protein
VLAEAAEQLELAAAARATTARLGGATARFFNCRATTARLGSGTRRLNNGAGRLFDRSGTATRGLDFSGTTTAGFGRTTTTTTTVTAQVLEKCVGLAFEGDHRNHQGHHSEGGSHRKTLTHHNSSK